MAVGYTWVSWLSHTSTNTIFFFQIHQLLFSHASVEVRGENTPERKFASTGDRTHNHRVMSPTRSRLSHPVGAKKVNWNVRTLCMRYIVRGFANVLSWEEIEWSMGFIMVLPETTPSGMAACQIKYNI